MTVLAPRPLPSAERGEAWPRRDPITELPLLILYPHSRCNCRCLMCDIWKDRSARELGAAEVRCWAAEWRALGVRRAVLSGGEALMHSDLWALAEPLRASGIGITLLTSGLLLARDAARIAEYSDDVIVSLDGPREVHDAIRNVPRAFDRAAEGVAALRRHRPDLPVSGRCTVQRRNAAHLRATVRAAREIGLDRISFLLADVTSEAFDHRPGWDAAPVALAGDDVPRLLGELDALEREHAEDFASGFIAESPRKLRARLQGAGPRACNAPWVSAVVESDGTVRPCFFHPALGNLRSAGSLAAVLNSPEALAFRAGLDVSTNPVCRRCVCSLELRRAE